MEIKSLNKVRKFKQEIKEQIIDEVGEPNKSLEAQIAKKSSHTEFEEETAILNKLRKSLNCLEEAQEKINSINTDLHEDKLEKYEKMRKHSDPDAYEKDSKVRNSDKAYKSLQNFLKILETGERQNYFLETPENIEKDMLEREKIVRKLLTSAKLVSRAANILEKQDKPDITKENYERLTSIADELYDEEISLLRTASEVEYSLSIAQKYVSKLENEK